MVTDEAENLIVAGRCISTTFLMQASVRILPTVIDMGDVAVAPARWRTPPVSRCADWMAASCAGLTDPIAAKVKAPGVPVFAEGLKVRAAQRHNDIKNPTR